MKDWKSIKEVSEELGITRTTVRNWIRNGLIKSMKCGHVIRIPNLEVERIKNIDR